MLSPYADYFGLAIESQADGRPICVMAPGDRVIGRIGYLHGGAIAGLLEVAAYAALEHDLGADDLPEIKPVGVSVDFMRNAAVVPTRAVGRVLRVGGRIANVTAEAWQDDPARPIAMARLTFSLKR
jgi:uncharacterized protein (TIGR00369 family)